jgi:hypothetical protein
MPIPILGALAGGAVVGTIAKIVITFIIFRVIKLLGIVFITYFGITTVFDYLTVQSWTFCSSVVWMLRWVCMFQQYWVLQPSRV